MRHLYTYLPKDNTAETEGILSTRLAPAGWEKYIERSGKHTKEEVLAWLDSLAPGFKRSNAISVFTEPIPDTAHPDMKSFRDAKELYAIPEYKELVRLGVAKALRRIRTGNRRGTDPTSYPKYRKIDWENIDPGKFLFSNVPHYLVELTEGKVPAEYVEKTASLISDAKRHYPVRGSHGWNHIEDVLARAKAMVDVTGEKWSPEMEAAVVYHDSGLYPNGLDKPEVRDEHELRGAEVARKELSKRFSKEQLKRIAAAIAEHRGSYKGAYTSKLSDLVSSADRGAPDLVAKVRRAQEYNVENDIPAEEGYARIVRHLQEKYGTEGYARFPEYYKKLYAKELAKFQKAADTLTPERVRRIVKSAAATPVPTEKVV